MPATTTEAIDPAVAGHLRAQHGEDRLLFEEFGRRRRGYYVEVGAFNGEDLSNTYFFERIGWEGVLIEPHPELARRCREARPRSTVFACAAAAPGMPESVTLESPEGAEIYASIGMDRFQRKRVRRETNDGPIRRIDVPTRTLDAILEEAGASKLDFLTIDVEGHERAVLQGFTLSRWRPEIVILERNGLVPSPAIVAHMYREGYTLGRRTGVNDWYFAPPSGQMRPYRGLGRMVFHYYFLLPFRGLARRLGRWARAILGRRPGVVAMPSPEQPGAASS